MVKHFFSLFIVAIISIICNPYTLTATDSFTLTGLNNAGITETIPLPKPVEKSPAPAEIVTKSTPAKTNPAPAPASTAPEVKAPAAGTNYSTPTNNIQITGRTLQITDVSSTTVNAGNHVNRYGDRFLYGHNSSAVFGGLNGLGIGSTFTVTYNGVSTNYSVTNIVVFEKNRDNGLLQINGSGNYMNAVSKAVHDGVHYDLSLMTCYGTSYGNGDASHRLVIFANAI